MRIAHILRRLSFEQWGGTEQVVWNLAKAQQKAGHEIRIFATDALCHTPSEKVEGLEILRFPAIYPWWPMPQTLIDGLDRKGGNPFVPKLGKALRDWKTDIVHCHAMGRIAELCMRTAGKLGVKCVISLHGGGANVPEAEASSLRNPTKGLFPWGKIVDYAMGWVRRIPEDADGIVCVGEDEYEHYAKIHRHVLYLPNGVDVALFSNGGMQNAPARTEGTLRLLCVARIDRQKNQMMLIEALGRQPDISVRLVGHATQQDYLDELQKRAAELGVSDRFSYAGALKPGSPELLDEYRNADVFVLPSRHEPFGIVVLEAWAANLPVIASNVGGLARLCAAHPNAALVFTSGDSQELDKAIVRLKNDKALVNEMKKAGAAAAAMYDWTALAAKLMDFYHTL